MENSIAKIKLLWFWFHWGKKMEEKKSKLTSKITGKVGDVFFFTMNQFDWPITQKNETMEAPQDRRFSNYFDHPP